MLRHPARVGIDLRELQADHDSLSAEGVHHHLQTIQGLTRRLVDLPVPTIAALNGLAVGMGSELSLCCDIRLASTSAYVWFSEAKRALFQTNGTLYLLPRMVGQSRAMEWMLSARRIPSEEMLRSGLVSHVYDDGEFPDSARKYAEALACNSPLSLKLLKQIGHRALSANFEEVLEMETEGMQACIQSDYLSEGLQAFAERREPRF